MSEYTSEDFAKARFAEHPETGATACRIAEATGGSAWTTEDGGDETDATMALRGWVPVVEAGAITLDALEAAWENAEPADECHPGDVVVVQDDEDNYLVRRMDDRSDLDSTARILSRAPREPWADLADVLTLAEGDIGGLNVDAINVAALLHERGVRVVGGDDDE